MSKKIILPEYQVVEVDNLDAWQIFVEQLMSNASKKIISNGCESWGHRWVFRGQMNAAYSISSTFERCIASELRQVESIERSLRSKERFAIEEFKRQAWRYVDNPSLDDLEWLALMRHHGVPTRLVDFTESPMVALYFALETEGDGDFAVWAFDRDALIDSVKFPSAWKENPDVEKIIQRYGENPMLAYLECSTKDYGQMAKEWLAYMNSDSFYLQRGDNNRKLAQELLSEPISHNSLFADAMPMLYFYSKWPNPRVLAQRGLFLMPTKISRSFEQSLLDALQIGVFGMGKSISMTQMLEGNVFRLHLRFIKFVFKRSMSKAARERLKLANCTKSTLYPDIEGVAGDVREQLVNALA